MGASIAKRRKGKASAFDWAALRNYVDTIDALPKGSEIARSDELDRYIRLERFIVKWTRVHNSVAARNAMIDLAEELRLDWLRAARLYVRLQDLSLSHRFACNMESYERAGDAVKELEKIRKSLAMIGQFSQLLLADNAGPRQKIAEKKLENAAHFWADGLRLESDKPGRYERWEEAKAHGFEHTKVPVTTRGFEPDPAGPFWHNYDSHLVVRTWLRNNVLFTRLVTEIIKKERAATDSDESGTRGISSARSLAGVKLPNLYMQLTGKQYRFSTAKDGPLVNANGPKFARMCYAVMGLSTPSLKTLRAHWQSPEARSAHRA